MRHVNYVRWGKYIMELFTLADFPTHPNQWRESEKFRPRVQTVLELACGTGKILEELAKAGFIVYGVDRSFEMVQAAAQRLRRSGLPAKFWCDDMRKVAATLQVDAVICLYDSLNYCLEPVAVAEVFRRVASLVRSGGLFIFDVCTRSNCRRNFHNYTESDHFGNLSYSRHAHYRPLSHLQINDFFIMDESRSGPALREQHVQRIYSLKELRAFATQSPWEEAGCFSNISHKPGTERADRVHFVFRRR